MAWLNTSSRGIGGPGTGPSVVKDHRGVIVPHHYRDGRGLRPGDLRSGADFPAAGGRRERWDDAGALLDRVPRTRPGGTGPGPPPPGTDDATASRHNGFDSEFHVGDPTGSLLNLDGRPN